MANQNIISGESPNEKVVMLLLKPPALPYTRELRKKLDKDPEFMKLHAHSVSIKMYQLLSKSGVFWDQEILERECENIVKEAVTRLKGC